eukprot:TRINITY_DN17375_c0_g1_i1.p1 TRINITY_DN17375_c0_g1~~TRINITY_DN17375_c0_g1_i1.p1  ORF type:complete len:136 (+),score=31.76 TRINITY_DN17375_c0_g1_i1:122-529(+)
MVESRSTEESCRLEKIMPPTISKVEETANSIQVFWEHKGDPNTSTDALPTNFGIKSTELNSTGGGDGDSEGNIVTEYEVDAKTESYQIVDLKVDTRYEVFDENEKSIWMEFVRESDLGKNQSIFLVQHFLETKVR